MFLKTDYKTQHDDIRCVAFTLGSLHEVKVVRPFAGEETQAFRGPVSFRVL
jgi:hypothetical protein